MKAKTTKDEDNLWQEIEEHYRYTPVSIRGLAEKFGKTKRQIEYRKKQGGWQKITPEERKELIKSYMSNKTLTNNRFDFITHEIGKTAEVLSTTRQNAYYISNIIGLFLIKITEKIKDYELIEQCQVIENNEENTKTPKIFSLVKEIKMLADANKTAVDSVSMLSGLDSDDEGMSYEEVRNRLIEHGINPDNIKALN